MSSTTRLLAAAAVLWGAQSCWAQADALQIRSWAAGCANCHGTLGVAVGSSASLAGAPKEDMAKKLLDYKAGTRPATVMHQIAKGYSDEQLQQLADYFSALKK